MNRHCKLNGQIKMTLAESRVDYSHVDDDRAYCRCWDSLKTYV